MSDPISTPSRDVSQLCPWFLELVEGAVADARADGTPLAIFEAKRSPERQDWLYAQGRSRPGKIVTKAQAWQSLHQYALAVDVAVLYGGKWSWDFDPGKVAHHFQDRGLEWLSPFEACHFQQSGGLPIPVLKAAYDAYGLERVWAEVQAATMKRS